MGTRGRCNDDFGVIHWDYIRHKAKITIRNKLLDGLGPVTMYFIYKKKLAFLVTRLIIVLLTTLSTFCRISSAFQKFMSPPQWIIPTAANFHSGHVSRIFAAVKRRAVKRNRIPRALSSKASGEMVNGRTKR